MCKEKEIGFHWFIQAQWQIRKFNSASLFRPLGDFKSVFQHELPSITIATYESQGSECGKLLAADSFVEALHPCTKGFASVVENKIACFAFAKPQTPFVEAVNPCAKVGTLVVEKRITGFAFVKPPTSFVEAVDLHTKVC